MKTFSAKPHEVKRDWFVIDATDKVLGRLAAEETGYGVPEHKTLKNVLSSKLLWEAIKDLPTVGVIRHDAKKRIYDIAWPMGVVAALIGGDSLFADSVARPDLEAGVQQRPQPVQPAQFGLAQGLAVLA